MSATSPDAGAANISAGEAGQQAAQHPKWIDFSVANAWNDTANNGLLVHDALVIRGGNSDFTVYPQDFRLTMQLATGAKAAYTALAHAAPTYQKINPLNPQTTTTAYEVDPSNDLGALTFVMVPAHGTVNVTVTFYVPDAVANSGDNHAIAYQ